MKKSIAVIAAALMLSFTGINASGIAAPAAMAATNQIDEQFTVEEDGQTVVYFITYADPDEVISKQTITWEDANGTKYVHIYKVKPAQDPFDFSSKVTWQDAAGNTYVRDSKTQTVTVYDANGNVLAVMPA